jgi:ATP-dependent DNA helicase DinG
VKDERDGGSEGGGGYLEDVFGADGFLARAFPGYERRDEQVQVARRVDLSIREGEPALVEAPTGTGKSLAYLVPLAYHLTVGRADILARRKQSAPADGELDDQDEREGEEEQRPRALIATANIALQEQILRKDVPALRSALPWPFTAAMAKGRANYLCLDRMDDSAAELALEPLRDHADRQQWLDVCRWAQSTQRGDFSELPFELRPSMKPRLAVSADDCIGRTCPRREECWSQKAKKEVKEADVIVANYHLFFAHLALSREGARLLPKFDVVILDEAHAAADIARDFFGFRVSPGAIRHAARLLVPPKKGGGKKGFLPTIDPELRAEIDDLSDRLFADLRDYRRSPRYHARLVEPNVVDAAPLVSALRKAANLYQATADGGEAAPARCAELRRAGRRARILATDVERAVKCEAGVPADVSAVYYIEEEDRGAGIPSRVTLCGAPLDPAPILRETVFESEELIAAVATSATLATSRGSDAFDYAAKQMGATAAEELLVGSPFDLPRQALIVVPRDAPDPKRKDYSELLAPLVVRAIELARGRTLGLFTSRRGLKVAAEAVRAELGDRYSVLVQGEAPRTQLVERFRRDVSSVLLGTRSFWAGVDVPGEALSCVLVDRVPFDTPEDPIADAMDERLGRRCFSEWAIPRAAIELRQGFGRLIRSRTDRGVVVLFDRRLATQGWGRKILRALPDCPRSDDLDDVRRFLDRRPEPTAEGARPARTRSEARRSA